MVIYGSNQNVPRHIARQLVNGEWASKTGQYEDIPHRQRHT